MAFRIKAILQAVSSTLAGGAGRVTTWFKGGAAAAGGVNWARARRQALVLAVAGGAVALVMAYPPLRKVAPGHVGVRTNALTGGTTVVREGALVVLPGIHSLRELSLYDQIYRPNRSGDAPFQSVEGLALGVDLAVRYAIDPARTAAIAQAFPPDLNGAVVEPAVQGVIYKVFTRYTVREIFSTKRAEIQQAIETELKPKLAADGIVLRNITIGKITLPPDYMAGMEKLLAEELESEKMRYTLDLKEKQVKQTALEADADKIKREKAAEAAGNEQIIAARAQEQAMQHILPFKQKQIEQRQLEAEAEKRARIKTSEGNAQARVIEAVGEADSRRKLADAEAYRQDLVGKVASAQMERDGAVISKHPLLIQKTMADKLSDKVQVIIAPPPADGGFIGAALLGGNAHPKTEPVATTQTEAKEEN